MGSILPSANSIPSDRGMTSHNFTCSLRYPQSRAPSIAAPCATASSGLTEVLSTHPKWFSIALRTQAVRRAIENHFGWVLNTSVNPDEAVAQGAAILGARLCGYLKEQVKLWDVIPLSLGIELADGKMEPILHANEQIPITVWRKGPQAFTTQR